MTEQYKKQDIAKSEAARDQLRKAIHAAISEAISAGITTLHLAPALEKVWEEYLSDGFRKAADVRGL